MRLKTEPEDFIVEEIPTEGFERSMSQELEERYLVVWVRKRDCAHFDLVRSITKRFSLPESDVGIGGIKDRRAITTQLITLPNAVRIRNALREPITLATDTGEARLELLGSTPRRMTIGTLFANKFSIRAVLDEEDRAVIDKYRAGEELVMPNYFGSQRFGRNLENPSIGYALLRGDFTFVRDTLLSRSEDDPLSFVRRISRRKRMFYVSAFQSALFNVELIERIEPGAVKRIEETPFDERINTIAQIADERVYTDEYGFCDPISIVSLGAELTTVQERLLMLLDLSERSFAIRQLPDIMFEPVKRASLVRTELERFGSEGDELFVSFTLPKGSYATVLLESLTARLRSHP